MMRLLAISDIHDNVSCVRKLREQEANRFDGLVVAGDIGRQRTAEVRAILKTYACPIIFVNATKYKAECRAALRDLVNRRGLDLRECVLVTQDRATHLGAALPGLLMHLYGHVHRVLRPSAAPKGRP